MSLVELQVNNGKFLARPTAKEQPDSEFATLAATMSSLERVKLEQQWEERRDLFFRWTETHLIDLDMILDQLHKYGVLFEWEYGFGECPPLIEAVAAGGQTGP